MKMRVALLVLLLILAGVACNFTPPEEPTPTTIDLDATLTALQSTQTALAVTPPPAMPVPGETQAPFEPPPDFPVTELPVPPQTNPQAQFGSISGRLMYPSEMIPAQRVVAFDAQSNFFYFVDTAENQSFYRIENLPPGVYTVVAYVIGQAGLSGGYSRAVPCGLSADCIDHSLIPVQVQAGQETQNIDPIDWYAPPGSYPPNPIP